MATKAARIANQGREANRDFTTSERREAPRFRAVAATVVGNVLEWFDFAAYAFFATVIARHFFPAGDDVAALMSALAAYGVGFVARPLGAIVFGRLGDRRGRKVALLISMPTMGFGTLLVGLTPAYAAIGVLAPILLVGGRVLQGFVAGGRGRQRDGVTFRMGASKSTRIYSGLQQCTAVFGTLLGSGAAALINSALPTEMVNTWGWRLPFLIGGLVVAPLGVFLRRNVEESPMFAHALDRGATRPSQSAWGCGANR